MLSRAVLCCLHIATKPGNAATMRDRPLPDGVLDVIRIAAGCKETLDEAVRLSRMEPDFVRAAAEFYLLQILLFPAADNYRVLGVRPGASRAEMRKHMRWLMKWLHPDRAPADWRSTFAHRVLEAWREAGNMSAEGSKVLAIAHLASVSGPIRQAPRPRKSSSHKIFESIARPPGRRSRAHALCRRESPGGRSGESGVLGDPLTPGDVHEFSPGPWFFVLSRGSR